MTDDRMTAVPDQQDGDEQKPIPAVENLHAEDQATPASEEKKEESAEGQ